MIIYSKRGKQFRILINDLREEFSKMNANQNESKLFRNTFISILIFYIFVIFIAITLTVFLHTEEIDISINFMSVLIAECYLGVIYYSTDMFVIYFASYIVLIQKLLFSELNLWFNKNIIITERELIEIKSKLDTIKKLIDKLSLLLCPALLFICGAIFEEMVTCFYFTIESIETSNFLNGKHMAANVGLVICVLRLMCICGYAERLASKVFYQLLGFILIKNF
jgi:hypothetical protein